jgi:hypothetical protein
VAGFKSESPAGLRRNSHLVFETSKLEGLGSPERDKVISALARILMQAAGLHVEELDDDER